MKCVKKVRAALLALIVLVAVVAAACRKSDRAEASARGADDSKIPITTRSEEAKKEFLAGRELADKLRVQDSVQHFDRAIAIDPDFAAAELARANSAATAKEFFEHLNRAVALSHKVSEGERLMILSSESAANGEVAKQKQFLDRLVVLYPNDERAQFSLGNYHFAQQEYEQAVAHYKKATALAPDYSPAYNILGYACRQQGDFQDAEAAFKRYIELIPSDPNPYDSYGELLLKMGRFDDSIAQYRKSLSIDPHFAASHFGIAAALLYLGKQDLANAELQKLADQARNDLELRMAYFGMTVVAVDGGRLPEALERIGQQYAVAEKKNDIASMAGDLQAKGNILMDMARYDAAAQAFDRSLQLIEGSSLSQSIKDNATLQHHFNMTTLAIARKDFATAKAHAEQYRAGAEVAKNPGQLKLAHELEGRIALAQKDLTTAIAELQQSNEQDPRNLYRLGLAFQARGEDHHAREYVKRAAEFNSLPQLNYAFVRGKAIKTLGR